MTNSNSSCVKFVLAQDGKTWVPAPPPEAPTLRWAPAVQEILDAWSARPADAEPTAFQLLLMSPDLLEVKRIPL